MAIQVIGFGGAIADVGGETFRALRVCVMPIEYGAFGVYRFSYLSGSLASPTSTVWSLRWTDAWRLCVVTRLVCDGLAVGLAHAAGFCALSVFAARSFTAPDSGGTALTLTGDNGKLRTGMGATLIGDLCGATTGNLTAGTRTLDTQAMARATFSATVANAMAIPPATILLNEDLVGCMPLVLTQNEGVIATLSMTASGTCQLGLTSIHAEVTAF